MTTVKLHPEEWISDVSEAPENQYLVGFLNDSIIPQIFIKDKDFSGGIAIVTHRKKSVHLEALKDGQKIVAWCQIGGYAFVREKTA